jgi:hypothetical protein
VLTDSFAARINDAAELKNMKGLGHAIDSDDFRSSTWLRTKDFQRRDLRDCNWSGWIRDHGFAGVGFHKRRQRAPTSGQAR